MFKRFFKLASPTLFLAFVATYSSAEVIKVKLKDGVQRVVELTPGKADLPLVVLVNGLVYNYERWNPVADVLVQKGYPVLRYYFRGQHRTLLGEIKQNKTSNLFIEGLTSESMGDELSELLTTLKIKEPVVVVGLSYGAHIAAQFAQRHPKQVQQVVFLAPLVRSLDKYDPQGAFLSWNLEQIKFWWGPFLGPSFYEYAYGMMYRGYLQQRVIPENIPTELQEHPFEYKEALFHLVRAVRDFNLSDFKFSKLNPRSVTYILAREENSAIWDDQIKAAKGLQRRGLQSLIYLPEADHAIPDSQGSEAAEILHLLVGREATLSDGSSHVLKSGALVPWDGKP